MIDERIDRAVDFASDEQISVLIADIQATLRPGPYTPPIIELTEREKQTLREAAWLAVSKGEHDTLYNYVQMIATRWGLGVERRLLAERRVELERERAEMPARLSHIANRCVLPQVPEEPERFCEATGPMPEGGVR